MEKNRTRILFFFFFVLACSKNSSAPPTTGNGNPATATHTYYVAPGGSDTNAGTLNAPFRSINTALTNAVPGDTIFARNGTYGEKIVFPKSGRLNKIISLKAYPGEIPVIDGSGLSISGTEALVSIRNVSYILFEGFDVCNYISTTPWVSINGIRVEQGAGNIQIRRNRIYNIQHNVKASDGRSGHAIEIIGNTAAVMTNILVEENEIHDCHTGYSENLTINGYVDGFEVRKNKIYNGENIGIDAAGGYGANPNPVFNYARNGIISDNEIYNIDMTTSPVGRVDGAGVGHGAIGIYLDGSRHITVERNNVHDCDRGIGIVSETNNFPAIKNIVRNNFVAGSWGNGIYLGSYANYTGNGTDSCSVVNNTLFYNDKGLSNTGYLEGAIRLMELCTHTVIKNNIVYVRPERGLFLNKQSASGSNIEIDHNLYYSTGVQQWIWNGTAYTDLKTWQDAGGNDAVSTVGTDPQFVSTVTPDLHIQAASPAKNSGLVIGADINGSTDIDGNPRIVNDKISKGAQQ
ncbi:DUF1565 domain-containing protein [Flavitalea flava]